MTLNNYLLDLLEDFSFQRRDWGISGHEIRKDPSALEFSQTYTGKYFPEYIHVRHPQPWLTQATSCYDLISILLSYTPLQMLTFNSRIHHNWTTDHVNTHIVVVEEDLSINLLFQLFSMDFVDRLKTGDLPQTTCPGGSANENADAIVPRFWLAESIYNNTCAIRNKLNEENITILLSKYLQSI